MPPCCWWPGIIATSRLSAAVSQLVARRSIPAAGGAVRVLSAGVGYLFVAFAVLAVLEVSIEHLLVGAGLAGVVLGIAAQQSLGNVFAGLVLLLARPFGVGDHVRIRAGALGGIFDAWVVDMSLTYVTLRTDDGPLKVPNSAMLAAGVGQLPPAATAYAPVGPATVAGFRHPPDSTAPSLTPAQAPPRLRPPRLSPRLQPPRLRPPRLSRLGPAGPSEAAPTAPSEAAPTGPRLARRWSRAASDPAGPLPAHGRYQRGYPFPYCGHPYQASGPWRGGPCRGFGTGGQLAGRTGAGRTGAGRRGGRPDGEPHLRRGPGVAGHL